MSIEEKLKKYRGRKAYQGQVEPYRIFTNEMLLDLLDKQPKTLAGLRKIKGFGEKRVEAYGKDILDILNGLDVEVGTSKSF